jgi:hypothetical protein
LGRRVSLLRRQGHGPPPHPPSGSICTSRHR